MSRGDQWTPEEIRTLEMRVAPIVDFADMQKIDEILSNANESWTGEQIRDHLFEAGFRVVKIDVRR
jgi:hypothetical protein